MIDRATLAGIAIGVGLLLMAQQLTRDWPSFVVLAAGGVLFVGGLLVWGDVREQHKRMVDREHGREEDRQALHRR